MSTKRPAAVITGVSSGIGFHAARYLIDRGWRVFGSVRADETGDEIKAQLGPLFEPLVFDVTDPTAIAGAAALVRLRLSGAPLDGLVNNAGIAVIGPLEYVSLTRVRDQFDINVLGVVAVTQGFLPLLREPGGRIVMISSVSGQIAFPFFGPYAGSKFALEALSDALRRELMIRGQQVIVIEPGSIDTPIWAKSLRDNVDERYADTVYWPALMKLVRSVERGADNRLSVERTSKAIYLALTTRRPRARYALPSGGILSFFLSRHLPTRWIDRIIGRRLDLKRK